MTAPPRLFLTSSLVVVTGLVQTGLMAAVPAGPPARAVQASKGDVDDLNRTFQSAVAHFEAGRLPEAAAELEALLPKAPASFEAQELLGLVYASMAAGGKSPDTITSTRAIVHLKAAVRLKPGSAEAHTNLAASLSNAGELEPAGEQFEQALKLEPNNFTANHNLAEFYLKTGKIKQALPLLEHAQKIDATNYDNGYDLALADLHEGRVAEAKAVVEGMIAIKDAAELHNLLAQIEEKAGNYVVAVNEFEKAAHMEPSDDHLFDWGSELLLHRTLEPAIEVFRTATVRYPQSPRLRIGLGMALYSRGLYEESVKTLLEAAALSPDDPRCYQFLSRAYDSSPNQADAVIAQFKRYAELEPSSALAQYYYAMSLWKGKRAQDAAVDLGTVEALLKKAIGLDGSLAEAHSQLGNLYADRREYQKSIPEYERALQLNPNLPEAHYRLGTDYVHAGQKDRAQAEFDVYQKLRAQHLAEVDKERAEVQQFVYAEKSADAPAKQ